MLLVVVWMGLEEVCAVQTERGQMHNSKHYVPYDCSALCGLLNRMRTHLQHRCKSFGPQF